MHTLRKSRKDFFQRLSVPRKTNGNPVGNGPFGVSTGSKFDGEPDGDGLKANAGRGLQCFGAKLQRTA